MSGLLRCNGIRVSMRKVRKSLKRLDPASHQIKYETAGRSLKAKWYNAD